MSDEIITLKIDGPIIKDTYPLHEVINILDDFHSIVDQSFLVLSGKPRLTKAERINYRILASRSREGSYIQDVQIVYELAEPFLPLLPFLASSEIWSYAKASFDFLKMVISLRQNGKEPKISAPDNNGIIVVNAPGSAPITINQNTFNIAESSQEYYKRITSHIDKGRINEISAIDSNKEGIILGNAEKQIFNPETVLEEDPIDIIGNIFDFNKDKQRGKIRVVDEQQIPPRDYPFELVKGQDPISYILAMTKEFIKMRCLTEVSIHSTGVKSIARLQAISIKEI